MRDEESTAYRCWEYLVAACVVWVAVDVPLQWVFGWHGTLTLWAADWLITVVFAADVLVHFRHPIHDRSPRRGASPARVLRSQRRWLVLDGIAALPLSFVIQSPVVLVARLLKLFRLLKILRHWRQRDVQRATLLRLVFITCWLGLFAHWLSCGWAAMRERRPQDDDLTHYVKALYWCVTTLATVGYGDITPADDSLWQMVYATAVMILGVGLFGYVIGNVAHILANIDQAKVHYQATLDRLTTFLNYRSIPPDLQRRIRDYYRFLWENRQGYDEAAILAELPPALRTEVALALKRDFIGKVPFFKGASQQLVRELALELRPVVFTPGDIVFHAGEIGRHMYFISRGVVEIVSPDGQTVFTTLTDGSFFGELALLFSQPRSATVRAVNYCDLYWLDKDTFDRILARYPDFAALIHEEARRRRNHEH